MTFLICCLVIVSKVVVIFRYWVHCQKKRYDWGPFVICHGSWICVLILCSSMLWTRSLCLSALPSYRAPDEVIRTVTGVARLHCLYLSDRFYCCGVLTLCVSLPGPEAVLAWSCFSIPL